MSTTAHFTLAQYELMVESGAFSGRNHQHVEFIRGEIREMSPLGTEHAWAVDWLNEWSFASVDVAHVIVRIQSTIRIPQLESAPQPDVMWLRRTDYSRRHPEPHDVLLLIEVADTSLAYDTGEKAELYADAGVQDYWVLNLTGKSVEVFRDPTPAGYKMRRVHQGNDAVHSLAFLNAALAASQIFIK